MKWGKRIQGSVMRATVLGMVTALLVGCASNRTIPNNPAQAGFASTRVQRPRDYYIQPGDEMDIKFYFNPEFNQTVFVRPDGRISLPLVDDVQAAGLAPSELDALLTQAYAQELRKPIVTVIVKTFTSQRVYVGGEVGKPGVVELTAGMTALHAVIDAGGFKETAKPEAVIIIRSGPTTDAPIPIRVDLEESIDGETTRGDIPLQAFDVVYVPKSAIANVNLFVKQYIQGVLMFRGWGFNPNPFFRSNND
jgi:protein involved in polysaccharide export with SLBB domain